MPGQVNDPYGAGSVVLADIASQADQTLLLNVSGASASPIAGTRTQGLGLLSGGAAASDVAPTVGLLNSQHAYAQSTVNTAGASLYLSGGIGRRIVTIVDWSLIDSGVDTVTLTLGSVSTGSFVSTATVITAGTGWIPATSNAVTAAALATYINTLSLSVTAVAVGAVCYITPTTPLVSFTLATTMAAGEGTVTSGTDGSTIIGTAQELTIATAAITATVPIFIPDGTTTAPGIAFASATTLGFYKDTATNIGVAPTTGGFVVGPASTTGIGVGPTFVGISIGSAARLVWTSSNPNGTPDVSLARLAAANLRQGAAPSATPVAQTFTLGEASRPGTDTDTGGASGTIRPGLGTGTGTASSLTLQGVVLAGAGSGVQSYQNMIKITGVALGFYNATPVALQTGVAVSAAGVHAALVNLGLITA